MRTFDPSDILVYIHVPKTAGSAVREVFQQWYGDAMVRNYYDERTGRPPSRPDGDARGPRVVFGHFNRDRGFGVEDLYPEARQFLTILRDPFEMALSNYHYLRRTADDWKQRPDGLEGGLESFLEAHRPNFLNHFPRRVSEDNYVDVIEQCFIEVGVAERLPESLARIAAALGRTFEPARLSVVNATPRTQFPTPAMREAYEAAHPLEFAVYRYAAGRMAPATCEDR